MTFSAKGIGILPRGLDPSPPGMTFFGKGIEPQAFFSSSLAAAPPAASQAEASRSLSVSGTTGPHSVAIGFVPVPAVTMESLAVRIRSCRLVSTASQSTFDLSSSYIKVFAR